MLKTFVSELRRRNVLPTVLPYVGLIWLLLQVVSVLQPMLNFPPLVGTFIAITLFAGFPVVLYLSWYFNLTLNGLEPIPERNSEQVSHFGIFKWSLLIIIMTGSGSIGYLYFGQVKQQLVKQQEGLSQVVTAKSIAVIPFRDLSPDQDQNYITDGLTEELTALLGKTSRLKVAAASSTFALVDKKLTAIDIGKRLQVDVVVTGSLRVTGNKLKIRTELIDISNGMTLWTQTFSREFKDIFAVEEEIGRSIVNLLEDRYLEMGQVTSAAKTASTDAYVMYLKGREQYRMQTSESMKGARKYFEQAIALDPEYAKAYVGLADTILMLEKGQSRFGILETDIAIQLADQQLAKALVREQNDAQTYAIQGKSFELKQDFDAAISSYDKALSINQSLAVAYMWKFLVYKKMNKHKEAMIAISLAYGLDPLSISTIYNFGLELTFRGGFDRAKEVLKRLVDEYPESPLGHAGLATHEFMQGKLANSLKHWSLASSLSPENEAFRFSYLDNLVTLGMDKELRQATDDPSYNVSLLIIAKDYPSLFKAIEFQLQSYPDDPWIQFEAGWYQVLFGDKSIGIDLLLKSQKGLSDEDMFAMPMCSPAIEFAWAFNEIGEKAKSKKYFDKCQTLSKAVKNDLMIDSFADHLSFRLAALEGNVDEAMAYLKLAVDHGWREWWTEKDPLLNNLQKTPELQALIDFIETDLAKQKAKAELLFTTPNTK